MRHLSQINIEDRRNVLNFVLYLGEVFSEHTCFGNMSKLETWHLIG